MNCLCALRYLFDGPTRLIERPRIPDDGSAASRGLRAGVGDAGRAQAHRRSRHSSGASRDTGAHPTESQGGRLRSLNKGLRGGGTFETTAAGTQSIASAGRALPEGIRQLAGTDRTTPSIYEPKATGLTRERLYKALSKSGNPSLGTVLKVLKALGLKLAPQVASASQPKRVTRLATR